jgi:hypothetical protein
VRLRAERRNQVCSYDFANRALALSLDHPLSADHALCSSVTNLLV